MSLLSLKEIIFSIKHKFSLKNQSLAMKGYKISFKGKIVVPHSKMFWIIQSLTFREQLTLNLITSVKKLNILLKLSKVSLLKVIL